MSNVRQEQDQTDECSSNPCLNSGTCVDKWDHYQCVCAQNFHGANCQIEVVPTEYSHNALGDFDYTYVMSKNWAESEAHCRSQTPPATLYDVSSQTRQDALVQIVTAAVAVPNQVRVWTAGKRPSGGSIDHFVWTNSNKDVTFSNWAFSEPDRQTATSNCLAVRPSHNWKWTDSKCELSDSIAICILPA